MEEGKTSRRNRKFCCRLDVLPGEHRVCEREKTHGRKKAFVKTPGSQKVKHRDWRFCQAEVLFPLLTESHFLVQENRRYKAQFRSQNVEVVSELRYLMYAGLSEFVLGACRLYSFFFRRRSQVDHLYSCACL